MESSSQSFESLGSTLFGQGGVKDAGISSLSETHRFNLLQNPEHFPAGVAVVAPLTSSFSLKDMIELMGGGTFATPVTGRGTGR